MSKFNPPVTLIATLGTSQSILTETIWALYDKGWGKVQKIEIITTKRGKEEMREWLKSSSEKPNGFEQVCKHIGIDHRILNSQILQEHIHVPGKANEINDIRSLGEDRAMGELIKSIVQKHADKTPPIIASLAGGRKTMAARLSTAMELFGRTDDQLVHVLVDTPYDDISNFYFPNQREQELEYDKELFYAKEANVELVDITFLQLGKYIRRGFDTSKSLDELMRRVSRYVNLSNRKNIHHLKMNTSTREVTINEKQNTFPLQDKLFALLFFMAWLNISKKTIVDVTLIKIIKNKWHEAFFTIYQNVCEKQTTKDSVALYWSIQNVVEIGRKKLTKDDYSSIWQTINLKKDRIELIKKINEGLPTNSKIKAEDLFNYYRQGAKSIHNLHVLPEDIEIEDSEGVIEKLEDFDKT